LLEGVSAGVLAGIEKNPGGWGIGVRRARRSGLQALAGPRLNRGSGGARQAAGGGDVLINIVVFQWLGLFDGVCAGPGIGLVSRAFEQPE
jgi:hypothetical protein